MAEQIPLNIIADVLTKLGSSAIQQIGSAFGVAKELAKLKRKLDTINSVLVDAEEKQVESHAVKAWVGRLKNVAYAADDLLDDFATHQLQHGGVARQVSNFFSSSNPVVFRFKMSNTLKDIKEEIDEIEKEIPMLSLIQGNITHGEVENSWRETHSFVLPSKTVGREEDKGDIIRSLVSSDNQENLSMVAIVGIGGLGKTTLAQLVYNDKDLVQYFEPRIWVCVSDNFDVKSLVKKILKEVGQQDVEGLELNGLKNLLHEKLSQKRCLLVLDDVWNENSEKWDQLKSLLMVVGEGSKILVTTRHGKVASIMGIDSPFILEGLKETHAWDLFSKIAFTKEPEKVHPEFVEIGKEIVNMCNGVPLVIKTLGTILRLKTEKSHWLSIKSNKNLLLLGTGNDNILSVLKLSYDNLPIYLKQCFSYCAIFPKDYGIEKKLLVQLWMAQGYIQPLDEKVGDQYFDELLSRSLLEAEKNYNDNILWYKMHDLIHDLAKSVIGSEVLILEDDVNEISEKAHHVSFPNLVNLKLKAPKVKHIRTLLNVDPIYYRDKDVSIRSIDFSRFKCLRVLSLNTCNLKKVPKSLGQLGHLRYLDLSYNEFEVLPNEITRLKNLQTLKIVRCWNLKEFPKDIRELINLRHWENDELLSHMPYGIGELTLLQSLPIFVVGNVGNGRGVGRLSELKGLNNLRGELEIVHLENARDAVVGSGEANLRAKQYIQSLQLSWRDPRAESGEDAESVMEGLQPHSNLKQLSVDGYGGGRFPSWMMNGGLSSMLPNLTTINLKRCSRCQTLPCFALLPQLKSLHLDDLKEVEYMEECSSEGPFFPSLENLHLVEMPKLKELWRKRDLPPTHPPPSFPCLSQLLIEDCELASLELHSSPLLSRIEIAWCPKLTSLLLPPTPLLSQLDMKYCRDLASLELHSSPLLSHFRIDCCKLTSLLLPPTPLLSVLHICNCDELTSLLLPPTPLLSQLDINCCWTLASLELHSSPLLSNLSISGCPKLTSLLLPPTPLLSKLMIKDCDELTSLELHSSPCLSNLFIIECPKLTSLLLPPTPLLSELMINDCDELTSLELHSLPCVEKLGLSEVKEVVLQKLMLATASLESLSINNIDDLMSLPDELHQHVSTLQTLEIDDCSRLATLPHWIGNLTSLTMLGIRKCPELKSLPQEMRSLTTLHTLSIDYSCGLALLPGWIGSLTSLTDLRIGSCPELTSLPEELRSLRILKSLTIDDWSDLTTLPHWIGSLSSLENLRIVKCPKLTSLPEEMRSLRTLKFLRISDCPHLSERCQREQGQDWPKIAHVPYISGI